MAGIDRPLSREELTAICQEWYDLSEDSEAIIGATVKLSQTVKTEDRPKKPEPQNKAPPTTQKRTGQKKPDRRARSPGSPHQGIRNLRSRRSIKSEETLPETSAGRTKTRQVRKPGGGQGNRQHDFRGDETGGGGTPQDTSTQPFHWMTRIYKDSKRTSRGQGKTDRNVFASLPSPWGPLAVLEQRWATRNEAWETRG